MGVGFSLHQAFQSEAASKPSTVDIQSWVWSCELLLRGLPGHQVWCCEAVQRAEPRSGEDPPSDEPELGLPEAVRKGTEDLTKPWCSDGLRLTSQFCQSDSLHQMLGIAGFVWFSRVFPFLYFVPFWLDFPGKQFLSHITPCKS